MSPSLTAYSEQPTFGKVPLTHHQILGETLELYEIRLHILKTLALSTNTLVDLLEEDVVHAIYLLKHLAAAGLLAHSQFVVDRRNLERRLEHTEVGKRSKIGDAKVARHDCLKINSDKGHEILHAACLLLVVGLASDKL